MARLNLESFISRWIIYLFLREHELFRNDLFRAIYLFSRGRCLEIQRRFAHVEMCVFVYKIFCGVWIHHSQTSPRRVPVTFLHQCQADRPVPRPQTKSLPNAPPREEVLLKMITMLMSRLRPGLMFR